MVQLRLSWGSIVSTAMHRRCRVYAEIHLLKAGGYNVTKIARRVGLEAGTVHKERHSAHSLPHAGPKSPFEKHRATRDRPGRA